MKMRRPAPACEQEVTITWIRGDEHALVYASDTRMIEKLAALHDKYPQDYILHDIYPEGVRYKVPVKLIKLGKPASEAMKAKGRELAARNRKERKDA